MPEIPQRRAARAAKLAGLPLGVAGRATLGLGRRITGKSAEEVTAELQARTAEQLFTVLGELKGGDFFGELALIEEHPRSATVIATEPTDCLLFPAWEFTALLEEHPVIALPIMRALIGRLHRREHHGA